MSKENSSIPSTHQQSQGEILTWEQKTLKELAFATLKEQQRARRWTIFFRLFYPTLLIIFLFSYLSSGSESSSLKTSKPHIALISLDGIISSGLPASAESINKGLRTAFTSKGVTGIILRINSPGGSPVQAGYINDAIYQLREKHPKIPIYTVITDICASGGYYIAVATDKIYADKASMVGSIGVLLNSFGFVDIMNKLGIERRLFTAGDHKGFLDPFSPTKEEESKHLQGMLDNIHQQFIKKVKEGRGDRLKNNPDLFSGLIWTGEQALDLGLIDGLGNSEYVAREFLGTEKIVDYTSKPDLLERLGHQFGTTLSHVLSNLETNYLQ
ncbi:signal peptide peptidase SppA [Candidatus Nitrosacidococcus tergens]|uniref:Peptidase, S49 (Protease IV) family n=1 Tax=Candidatus Nitrosacidococcus tergens TaxID=553981 RepID=A0A7G1QBB5_9GAMM|nr:signal peptide peptidase SppA [Candidatus Nitrosacidococcus tergens]CAB1276898.1 Peptidase, S49 (Protease IV) family [Candidatus Nitrosacidococcus tergens]